MSSPAARLDGRTIVVTRAAAQAQSLVDRLDALGARPLVVPLIEIVDATDGGTALADALGRLADYEWLVVTSANGAARVEAATAVTAGRPRVAAVGGATAAALSITPDLVPVVQSVEGLVAEFPRGAGRVLVAQAETASAGLVEGLTAKGWSVDIVAAYRTTAAVPSSETLLRVLAADAVLFASGSAVRSWIEVFGRQLPPVAVAIGPTTAEVAADFGLKIDAVATDHSLDGLVEALLNHLEESE